MVPAIIGVILGPMAEARLRKALQIANGDWSVLWSTTFSICTYAVMVLLLIALSIRVWGGRGQRSRMPALAQSATEE